ncbi:sodium/proton exchanger family protein [Synechococcus sp. RS9909]|uniref:cation:proton antiporter n=1 Tax=unclassified Synechococcus TaxID=2626047 RepID=UPI000069099B|nr:MULTISPECIES: cation:proton antiporter [unclassified Synechococcus]EAQ68526.1 putative transporter [Synechococcus sp. RS9917]QNI78562.1 sodium/proton exchanger family protein [Synechococcus sp. RS9909]
MDIIPVENQARLFLAIAIAAWLPAVMPWLVLPSAVLEILLGVMLGPHGFQLDHPGPALTLLANLGMGFLFLQAGFELDPRGVLSRGFGQGLGAWLLSIPLAALSASLLISVGTIPPAGVMWVMLALITTSLGIVQPLLRDRAWLPTNYRSLLMVHAVVGEVIPVAVLSVLQNHHSGRGMALIQLMAYALISALLLILLLKHRQAWEQFLQRTMGGSSQVPMRFVVGLLAVMVALAHLLEVDLILGALMAGVLLRFGANTALWPQFQARLDGVGGGFLVPLFFVVTGMNLDFHPLLSQPQDLLLIPCLVVVMLLVRGLPVWWMSRRDCAQPAARIALAFDVSTQLPLVVAVVVIAQRQGVLSMRVVTLFISAAMVTVMLFPGIASRILALIDASPRTLKSEVP